jgi:formamidopyrimidine-DNA glycosylase
MPELPDVEVFRRRLARGGLRRRIARVRVHEPALLHEVSSRSLTRALEGRSLEATQRRGKYLLARTDQGRWLVLHFGMTGDLQWQAVADKEPDYAVMSLELANGRRLVVTSRRKLGRIRLVDDPGDLTARHELGPDALSLDHEAFDALLVERRGAVKSALMDQSAIAGLGNIYLDEILFHARLHPETGVQDLDARARSRLYRSMRQVARRAIEGHANPDELPRSWLIHRRESGARCPRCGGRIERRTVGGRSSYLCPACQPRRSRG